LDMGDTIDFNRHDTPSDRVWPQSLTFNVSKHQTTAK